jgi:hypothetical protein
MRWMACDAHPRRKVRRGQQTWVKCDVDTAANAICFATLADIGKN